MHASRRQDKGQTLHRVPDRPLLLRFRIGRLGTDLFQGLEFGAGLVRGHQHASGVRLITVPPIQAYAWCLACVELCPLGREGPRFIILMRQQMNEQTQ